MNDPVASYSSGMAVTCKVSKSKISGRIVRVIGDAYQGEVPEIVLEIQDGKGTKHLILPESSIIDPPKMAWPNNNPEYEI